MKNETLSADDAQKPSGISRRGFLRGVGVVGAGAVIIDHPLLRGAETTTQPAAEHPSNIVSGQTTINLTVNGKDRSVTIEPRVSLLNALRDYAEPPITGPKLVCDIGTCGACTVLLNDKPVYGCLVLAVDAVGKKITTAEGFGTPDHMSAVQEAFVAKDAMMCGFCTPGFVTTVSALLKSNPHPTVDQVREGCKGNFCKCGTYPHVFAAAMQASEKMNLVPSPGKPGEG